jgi:predicted DNA-binding protein (MmcQ/YjbR family)
LLAEVLNFQGAKPILGMGSLSCYCNYVMQIFQRDEPIMTRQDVFSWCRRQYGTEPDYPWNDWNAVLRHTDNNKWYGVIIEVNRSKLGMDETGMVDVLNVKCDPTIIGMLRMQPGFYPAYHMNKEKWVSILLCGPSADDEIKELIEFSYQLTSSRRNEPKRTKKQ